MPQKGRIQVDKWTGLSLHQTDSLSVCHLELILCVAMLFHLYLATLFGFRFRVLDCHPIRAGQPRWRIQKVGLQLEEVDLLLKVLDVLRLYLVERLWVAHWLPTTQSTQQNNYYALFKSSSNALEKTCTKTYNFWKNQNESSNVCERPLCMSLRRIKVVPVNKFLGKHASFLPTQKELDPFKW